MQTATSNSLKTLMVMKSHGNTESLIGESWIFNTPLLHDGESGYDV